MNKASDPTGSSVVSALGFDGATEVEGTGDFSSSPVPVSVTLAETTNESVKFNDEGGNIAHVGAGAAGQKDITLGKGKTYGGDLVISDADNGRVNVTSGAGADQIVVRGDAQVNVDMKNGGADKLHLASDSANVNVVLSNYKASSGAGIATAQESAEDLAKVIEDGGIDFGTGKIEIKSNTDEGYSAKVTFESNADPEGSTIFNLFDKYGDKQAVGFTHKAGGVINVGANTKDDYILVGNKDGKKTNGSTIAGGKGNDTIFAGEGDIVSGGEGSNQISLDDTENRESATVAVTAGRNTITGLHGGFDEDTGDVLNVSFNNTTFKYQDGVLTIKNSDFRAEASVSSADVGAGTGEYIEQRFVDGTKAVNAAIAANSDTVIDASKGANYFKGNNSGVTFAEVTGDVNVNFSGDDWNSTIDGAAAGFDGITNVIGGTGKTTLYGGAANEVFTAGNGDTSLYGGGGKNTLVGYSGEDKDAKTKFFVLGNNNGAQNTIQNFAFADTAADGSVADVIEIDTNNNFTSNVYAKGTNDVVIEVSNRNTGATERVVVEGAMGRNMYVTDNRIAQVNSTTLDYDGQANYFVATGQNAVLTVNDTTSTEAQIWLDNPGWRGQEDNFIGDIRTIDASTYTGKAELAGGKDTSDIIIGGLGKNSLWGGEGAEGNDSLVGGAGQNNFYYTMGNGDDTISGTHEGDTVFLTQVSIDQITGASFEGSTATLNFADGGRLTIQDADKANYVVTSGEEMRTYRVENGAFVQN